LTVPVFVFDPTDVEFFLFAILVVEQQQGLDTLVGSLVVTRTIAPQWCAPDRARAAWEIEELRF
jgi:hypothetical protein